MADILLVDDNTMFARALLTALGQKNFRISSVPDYPAARRMLRQRSFDAVILDLELSGTPLSLAQWIRAHDHLNALPLLYLSKGSNIELIARLQSLDICEHLDKPVKLQTIEQGLNFLLGGSAPPKLAAQKPSLSTQTASTKEACAPTPLPSTRVSKSAPDIQQTSVHPSAKEVQVLARELSGSFQDCHKDLFQLLWNPHSTPSEFAIVVEQDRELRKSLLRRVNSPEFGLQRKVLGVGDLCDQLCHLDYCLELFKGRSVGSKSPLANTLQGCWKHMVMTGFVAERIAVELVPEFRTEIQQAGFLHAIGILAMIGCNIPRYERVPNEIASPPCNWSSLERQHFGFDHSVLGALIAERLNYPARVVDLIFCCDDPEDIPEISSWALMVASLTVQSKVTRFPRRARPEADLKILAGRFPHHWKKLVPKLNLIFENIWECHRLHPEMR